MLEVCLKAYEKYTIDMDKNLLVKISQIYTSDMQQLLQFEARLSLVISTVDQDLLVYLNECIEEKNGYFDENEVVSLQTVKLGAEEIRLLVMNEIRNILGFRGNPVE